MCVCVFCFLLFFLLLFLYQSLLFVCLKTTHAKLDILFVFFLIFSQFVSSFEQSNGNCMDFFFFFACFYCLKSGKCIIISFAFSFCFSKSRSSLPFRANVRFSLSFLCRSKWDTHKKWIFFSFLKFKYGQIVSKNAESSCVCV